MSVILTLRQEQDADIESYKFMLARQSEGKEIIQERSNELEKLVKKYSAALLCWKQIRITLMQELNSLQKLRDEIVELKDSQEI